MESLIHQANKIIWKEETQILKGDHSNIQTMCYFAALANYYYCGGKTKLPEKMQRITSRDWLSTDMAKANYIRNAEIYILGGWIYLKVKHIMNTKKLVDKALDISDFKSILSGIRIVINRWNIDVSFSGDFKMIYIYDKLFNKLTGPHLIENILNGEVAKNIANKMVESHNNKFKVLEDSYYRALDKFC